MRILIPVIVGSLIGYLTNWLAIKMLFRPHYEKKIFGITVPFTPGLIPKERENIAENIGNTVGVHLLSTETIIESISNSENEKKIKSWIDEKIENLRREEMTLDEYIESKIGEKYKLANEEIINKISYYIIDFIRNEKFKKSLNLFIDETIDKYNTSYLYGDIEIRIKSFVKKIVDSGVLKEELVDLITKFLDKYSKDTSTIEEIIPIEVFNSIDLYLDEHEEEIGDSIRDILKDKEIKAKIENAISNVIFDRSNKLLMAVISPDIISKKIFESIEKYIEKKETNKDIIEMVKFLVEKLKSSKVSNIANTLNKTIEEIYFEPILNDIINNFFKEEKINNLIYQLLNLLKEKEDANKEIIKDIFWIEIQKIIASEYIESKTKQIVEDTIKKFSEKTISDLFKGVNENVFLNMYNFLKNIFQEFAKFELPRIIEMFNVSKIVEDKINSFGIDYTEKLILDIAKKELNQITRLGALLGGILGLLSPLLQYIY
ncbi:MAG TPA: DUF445 family protein [Tissierellaceae bacterium]|nr:DUF445 family protein [Tissierellaceae bacterium]